MDGHGKLTVCTAHILEPFFTTKQVGRGTGLGLCRRIVQRYHGDVRLTSSPGDTRFQVLVLIRSGWPRAQTGSRRPPPWAATAQITKMFRVMMSSDQNG
jgi:nitrogen-specific signal transduction histidine kinase